MFVSKFGPFNGSTWEGLCQQVFKRKYEKEDYQPIPASPGDFGLEGFTLTTGWGFQCYCPDKHYNRKELYEKQRDKITEDLGKLKTNEAELKKRLGATKLCHWVFVTPEFDKNELLAHARAKENDVRGWGLPFITDDFRVLLYDGDNYLLEINAIRALAGEAMIFDEQAPALAELKGEPEEYERNVHRKCEARLADRRSTATFDQRVQRLQQRTLESFLEADGHFRRIAATAPVVYIRLVRLINEFENFVVESSATWTGTAEALTTQVREKLKDRIVSELAPAFDETNASIVARQMVARWLAICELDYE